jgi:hypothetical protein
MTALTIFTWGYAGWGSSTLELKKAMDAVEQARAYAPPYFVDLRMARRGRALGFRENSFEQTVGKNRYQWMPSLGNRRIVTRSGPRIQINEPAAVEELLGIGLRRIVQRQRLIIFCSCGLPGLPGRKGSCHRVEVASLLLNTAVKRKVSLTMVEWPGGQPTLRTVRIADRAAQAIRRGTRHAPLGTRQPAPDLLGLPWGSIVQLKAPDFSCRAIADPPVYRGGQWLLPIPFGVADQRSDIRSLKKETRWERRLSGLEVRKTANRLIRS